MPRDIREGTPSPSERPCKRHDDVRDLTGQRVAGGPCVDAEGRRVTHTAYVFPRRGSSALRLGLGLATLLAAVIPGLYFLGTAARPDRPGTTLRSGLSPAPTSSLHSLASFDCAQCHQRAQDVEDVRCERCHDATVSARLSNAAHVFQGTGDMRQAMAAPVVTCATCHLEHRGEGVSLADVDDRECGTCHRSAPGAWTKLTSLERHPEFALVRAGIELGSGLRWFNHKLHLKKVAEREKGPRGCEACHERGPGAPSFNPISFSTSCATCHEDDLSESAGSLMSSTVAALGPLPAALRSRGDLDDPGRQVVTGLKHADPWVLKTVQGLRQVADSSGFAADRLVLDRQFAQLELALKPEPVHVRGASWARVVATPSASEDGPSGRPTPDAAWRDAASAIESLAKAIGAASPDAPAIAQEAAGLAASATEQPDGSPAPAPVSDASALRRLVDAIAARAQEAGDQDLLQRANALRARVDKLPAAPVDERSAGVAAARQDALLGDLRPASAPGVRDELSRLRYLAQLSQGSAGGLDPTAYDLHRAQTLGLLNALQLSIGSPGRPPDADAILARSTALRRQVLSIYYGLPPDLVASHTRFFRARKVDRSRLDAELGAVGLRTAPARERPFPNQAVWEWRLEQLRGRFAAAASAPAVQGLARSAALDAIAALIGREAPDAEANASKKNRCTLCHELTPAGDQLAPVRMAGGPVLDRATFNHEKHMSGEAGNCETCHTSIRESTASRDVNLPNVASCRTCHASGKQAARASGCETCHKYHAPARAALMWIP